jgi:hypothetical protein
MKYIDKTKDGYVTTRNVIKLYDIIQLRKGYWKDKLSIITDIKDEHIHCRIIENGMDMCVKIKDVSFVNHNTKAAAKAYFDLCEKMKEKFVARYSDIDYIKEHFDDDPLICNDIVAKTICDGAGIYISSNSDRYSALAVNWLANHKELISAIIRIGDIPPLMEKTHKDEIEDIGYSNYIKLVTLLRGV